jgi:hypothetical protein
LSFSQILLNKFLDRFHQFILYQINFSINNQKDHFLRFAVEYLNKAINQNFHLPYCLKCIHHLHEISIHHHLHSSHSYNLTKHRLFNYAKDCLPNLQDFMFIILKALIKMLVLKSNQYHLMLKLPLAATKDYYLDH